MSGVTYSKTWSNGETLTHTDLNANFTAVNTAVGAASGLASLNSSSLVVEDPANATATKAAGKICKWGTSEAFQCSALTATTVGCAAITSTSTIQGTQFTSTIADGTAPLVVTSTTKVDNLNADTVDGKNPGSASGLATLDSDTRLVEAANKISDGTNAIKFKIIDIGDWNMDASASTTVAHGLTLANIRNVSCLIRNDDNTSYFNFNTANFSETSARTIYAQATTIALSRSNAGYFDNANFDSTSYNRGWITITYVE